MPFQSMHSRLHRPVLPEETLALLNAAPSGASATGLFAERLFVDATLGVGGHTELILRAAPENRVIGLDRDAEVIALARERLAQFGDRFTAIHTDFREIKARLQGAGAEPVAGILADLGVSSFQLDTSERGFSFKPHPSGKGRDAGEVFAPPNAQAHDPPPDTPLDMRMDRSRGETAADLVRRLSERELADLIFQYGEERAARRIARRIVRERERSPITSTTQLAELVVKAVQQKGHWRIHPATRTFQALRIAVNRELEGLEEFVADAIDLLDVGGRLVVISFHSLEDRIIKQALKYQSGLCRCPTSQPECRCGAVPRVEILTRKALQPSEEEVAQNPRARSAKLRACQKL